MITLKELEKKYPEYVEYAVADPEGMVAHLLNANLVQKQSVSSENLKKIIKLHQDRYEIFHLMNAMDPETDKEELQECYKELTELEFNLQELWGFEKDKMYHRFWNQPHCSCPSMDNDESYPYGPYYISKGCYHYLPDEKKEFEDFVIKNDTDEAPIELLNAQNEVNTSNDNVKMLFLFVLTMAGVYTLIQGVTMLTNYTMGIK